jgi:16S rRNA (cytosine967-C5)-methyltransferase
LIVEEGQPLKVQDGHGLALANGWFVVQDEASQLVALLTDTAVDLRVLDTCASPGGKTTAMAAAMADRGLVVACDVRRKRIDLLKRTVGASGSRIVRIVQADAEQPLPFTRPFDRVLLDAPCSGLGTLRRDPDIRWRRREEDLPALASAQLRMIAHAAACVAPGGRLVYATCSSEPEENDDVVSRFLAAGPGFRRVDARTIEGVPAAVIDQQGYLRTAPHLHGLEAFFGAVLERTEV